MLAFTSPELRVTAEAPLAVSQTVVMDGGGGNTDPDDRMMSLHDLEDKASEMVYITNPMLQTTAQTTVVQTVDTSSTGVTPQTEPVG